MFRGGQGTNTVDSFWSTKYGTNVPWVQNYMTSTAFIQVRRYIKFANDDHLPKRGDPRYHPLQKINPFLNVIKKQLAKAWILGEFITIDESTIKYMGRAISYVVYNPKKPIKHGVKVYCLTCAVTGYLYSFEIYTGNESQLDGAASAVVLRLIAMCGAG